MGAYAACLYICGGYQFSGDCMHTAHLRMPCLQTLAKLEVHFSGPSGHLNTQQNQTIKKLTNSWHQCLKSVLDAASAQPRHGGSSSCAARAAPRRRQQACPNTNSSFQLDVRHTASSPRIGVAAMRDHYACGTSTTCGPEPHTRRWPMSGGPSVVADVHAPRA